MTIYSLLGSRLFERSIRVTPVRSRNDAKCVSLQKLGYFQTETGNNV